MCAYALDDEWTINYPLHTLGLNISNNRRYGYDLGRCRVRLGANVMILYYYKCWIVCVPTNIL